MSVTTTILILLILGYTIYSKINKALEENVFKPENNPLKGDEADADYDVSGESQPSSYFSYETESVETTAQSETAPVFRPAVPKAPVQEPNAEACRPQFDLRRAVIGQVILTNSYINEINQQNQ